MHNQFHSTRRLPLGSTLEGESSFAFFGGRSGLCLQAFVSSFLRGCRWPFIFLCSPCPKTITGSAAFVGKQAITAQSVLSLTDRNLPFLLRILETKRSLLPELLQNALLVLPPPFQFKLMTIPLTPISNHRILRALMFLRFSHSCRSKSPQN